MALNVGKLFATLGLDKREFDKGMDQVDGSTSRLGRAGSKLLDAGKKIAKVGAAAGVAGFTALGVAALKSGADIENTQRVLSGLYGDADAAADVMGKLRDVASTSPIDYNSYTRAAESLAYAGVKGDEAVETLTNVGLALTAAGGGAEEMDRATDAVLKMVNAGKVSLDSLQQLSDSGVPIISGLADHFGVSMEEINKMASDGAIGLDDVMSVMQNGTGETFQQMIAAGKEASGSFQNQWKIAKDNLLTTLGEAMQPVMPMLTGALNKAGQAVAPAIGKIAQGMAGAFEAVVPAIAPVIDVVASLFSDLIPVITPIIKTLAKAFESMAPTIKTVGKVLANSLGKVLEAIAPVIPPIAQALAQVAGVLGGALASVITAIAPVIAQVADVFADVLLVALQALEPVWPILVDALSQVAELVGGVLSQALEAIAPYLPDLVESFIQLSTTLLEALMPILPALVEVLLALMSTITPLLPVIVRMADLFATVLAKAMEISIGVLRQVIEWVAGLMSKFAEAAGWVGEKVGTIVGYVTGIPGRIREKVNSILDILKGPWRKATTWIGDKITWIVNKVKGIKSRIDSALTGLFNIIKAPFVGAFNFVRDFWNNTIGKIQISVPSWVPKWGGKSWGFPQMHTGGLVPGGPGHEPLVQLQGGEMVLSREQVKALTGPGFLAVSQMNVGRRGGHTEPSLTRVRGGGTVTTGDVYITDKTTAEAWLRQTGFYVAQGRL